MSLTPKESAFCHFLADYQTRTGLAPTYREIAEHLGLRALGSVQQYVRQLTAKGYLAVEGKGRARALKLVRSATGEGQIWLLGRVAAGAPIEPIERAEPIEVPRSMLRRAGDHFALQVRGDSMADAGILDGDLVVVRSQATAENGETVVALVEGLATVKRLHREGQQVWLVPANAALAPVEVTGREGAIRGVVVGVMRYL